MTNIGTTYGSVLLGSSAAFALSGVVAIQCLIYFKLYPSDRTRTKALVCVVWILDLAHSAFLCASLVDYFITFFGVEARIDHIPWSIAFTVLMMAIQTFITHCYFAFKVFKSSQRNWFITVPIVVLAAFRLMAASVSTSEMILLRSYAKFVTTYPRWIFTTGLSLSTTTEILITGSLCYYLREMRGRTASTTLVQVVDALTLYTLNTGGLTCIVTVASLICWLTMPNNLVFLGLHFVIGKLYANSLLASLNTRKEFRDMRKRRTNTPWDGGNFTFLSASGMRVGLPPKSPTRSDMRKVHELEITIEQTVQQSYERHVNMPMGQLEHGSRDKSLSSGSHGTPSDCNV